MANVRKPKNPKFPSKPKSESIEALQKWEDRCNEIRKAYDEKLKAYNDYSNRKQSILNRVRTAKNLSQKKAVKRKASPRPKKSKGKKKGKRR